MWYFLFTALIVTAAAVEVTPTLVRNLSEQNKEAVEVVATGLVEKTADSTETEVYSQEEVKKLKDELAAAHRLNAELQAMVGATSLEEKRRTNPQSLAEKRLTNATSFNRGVSLSTDVTSANVNSKTYKTLSIEEDKTVWLAENLYELDEADLDNDGDPLCYNEDPAMCNTYGALYTFEQAQTACLRFKTTENPDAVWRLATDADFKKLEQKFGMLQRFISVSRYGGQRSMGFGAENFFRSNTMITAMGSTQRNAADKFDFSPYSGEVHRSLFHALPAGYSKEYRGQDIFAANFADPGKRLVKRRWVPDWDARAYFWTASTTRSGKVWRRRVNFLESDRGAYKNWMTDFARFANPAGTFAISVRCVTGPCIPGDAFCEEET